MHDFTFAGRRFCALADRALFWPARRALLVADLHFEKASWFAAGGQMLPPFDSLATATRLAALAARLDAQEIWALGDSFHDAAGPQRMMADAREVLGRMAKARHIIWIAGNHDAAADLPGDRREDALVDGIMLRHEARADEVAPEISGHFHPKLRLNTAAKSVSRACFVCDAQRLILPAFGALTGGLDVTAEPIRAVMGAGAQALVATDKALLRFVIPQLGPKLQRKSARIRMSQL